MCQIRDFEEDIEDNSDQDAIFQLKYFSNNLKMSVFWVFDEKIKKIMKPAWVLYPANFISSANVTSSSGRHDGWGAVMTSKGSLYWLI